MKKNSFLAPTLMICGSILFANGFPHTFADSYTGYAVLMSLGFVAAIVGFVLILSSESSSTTKETDEQSNSKD